MPSRKWVTGLGFVLLLLVAIQVMGVPCKYCIDVDRASNYYCNVIVFPFGYLRWCIEYKPNQKEACVLGGDEEECLSAVIDNDQVNFYEYTYDAQGTNGQVGWWCKLEATGKWEFCGEEPCTGEGYIGCEYVARADCWCLGCTTTKHWGLQVCPEWS